MTKGQHIFLCKRPAHKKRKLEAIKTNVNRSQTKPPASQVTTYNRFSILETTEDSMNTTETVSISIPKEFPLPRQYSLTTLSTNKLKITPNLELSSDHTPIIIEYRNKPILYSKPVTLCNKSTKWRTFKEIIESKINCNIPLKTPEHIEQAVATLTATIQEAARTTTTPESVSSQTITIPQEILDKIREKRKAKAKWQKHRT